MNERNRKEADDVRIIEEMYDAYAADLYRYLFFLTHDAALSEDLLSETFVRAIGALSAFRGESSEKTWLFGIARNVWLSQLKKSNRISRDEPLAGCLSVSAEEIAENRALIDRIKTLMNTRSETERTIFWMRADGYAYAQIAARCNIHENTARVLFSRVKRWLTDMLSKEELL